MKSNIISNRFTKSAWEELNKTFGYRCRCHTNFWSHIFSQEIHVNSNIGPPTGENDGEKSHAESNHDSRDPGKDGEGVYDSYVHLVPEMVKFVMHTSL